MKSTAHMFVLIAAGATLVGCANVRGNPDSPFASVGRAFLVGINDYDSEPDLKYARADCLALKRTLERHGHFAPENIVTLVDSPNAWRGELNATTSSIRTRFDDFLARCQPNDLVVVYLSGHGQERDGESYFIPSDGTADRRTLIRLAKLRDQLNHCVSRDRMLIVDMCRNDVKDPKKSTGNRMTSGIMSAATGSFLTLFSCDSGQYSNEKVFTPFLIRGLKGEADVNRDQFVDARELAQWSAEMTAKHQPDQDPQWQGEFGFQRPLLSFVRHPPGDTTIDGEQAVKSAAEALRVMEDQLCSD